MRQLIRCYLFSAPKNIPHAPPEDLIATKLAIQPVIWPDLPKVQQEKKPAPPKKVQGRNLGRLKSSRPSRSRSRKSRLP